MKPLFKIVRRVFTGIFVTLSIFLLITYFYMKQPKFGKLPSGERLEHIRKSPNYKEGKFQNQTYRPTITEGYSMLKEAYKALFTKTERSAPAAPLPSVKTNLHTLPADKNLAIWFGHSSVYMQLDGKKLLIDPVFSGNASPIPGSVKAYLGTDLFSAEDMPAIDYLLISHDHYDHLDYATIKALQNKVNYVICGLGVGAHFEYWGFKPEQIIEKDWYEKVTLEDDFVIHTLPTHHTGGRSFKSAQALWLSFMMISNGKKIFYSGDGGYDAMYKEIGEKFGEIDYALMECGQYNLAWQSVHKLPEEVARATVDIKARRMLPVHHSKFTLARHSWDEPLIEISKYSNNQPYKLDTPMIGELIDLDNPEQSFTSWWVGLP